MAAYLARHAFIVGTDGAAQVSKPARVPPGAAGAGAGAGLLAGAGPAGFGLGFGVGLDLDGGGEGVLGGENQAAPGPVIG